MSATKTKPAQPTPRPPAPEPQPDAGKEWRTTLLRFKSAVEQPEKLLTLPQPQTSIPDLLSVLELLEPHQRDSGSLLAAAIRIAVPGLPIANGQMEAVYQFCKTVTSTHRRELIEEVLLNDLLVPVETLIAKRLAEPNAPRDVAFLPSDFGDVKALRAMFFQEVAPNGAHFHLGLRDALPDKHPLKGLPDWCYYRLEDDKQAVVLGRATLGVLGGEGAFSQPGPPRPFHHTNDALIWTKLFRDRQLRRRLENQLPPEQYTASYEALAKLDNPKLPKPWTPPPPPLVEEWPDWLSKLTFILDGLLRTAANLKRPPETASLNDLLAVRESFGVEDNRPQPLPAAALNWSGRIASDQRRNDLYQTLPAVYNAISSALCREVESALLFASADRPR